MEFERSDSSPPHSTHHLIKRASNHVRLQPLLRIERQSRAISTWNTQTSTWQPETLTLVLSWAATKKKLVSSPSKAAQSTPRYLKIARTGDDLTTPQPLYRAKLTRRTGFCAFCSSLNCFESLCPSIASLPLQSSTAILPNTSYVLNLSLTHVHVV